MITLLWGVQTMPKTNSADTRRAIRFMKELGVSAFKSAQMAGISYTCVYRNVKKLRDAGQDIPNHRRVKEKKS